MSSQRERRQEPKMTRARPWCWHEFAISRADFDPSIRFWCHEYSSPVTIATVLIVVMGVGSLLALNYTGFCMSEFRYRSDDKIFRRVVSGRGASRFAMARRLKSAAQRPCPVRASKHSLPQTRTVVRWGQSPSIRQHLEEIGLHSIRCRGCSVLKTNAGRGGQSHLRMSSSRRR